MTDIVIIFIEMFRNHRKKTKEETFLWPSVKYSLQTSRNVAPGECQCKQV